MKNREVTSLSDSPDVFSGVVSFKPVSFTESETIIPGIRTEYHIKGDGVKFHFWPDPEFPENFGVIIGTAFANFPEENLISEYVAEVDSWYGEIRGVSVGLSDNLVESLISKISRVVSGNG